jgi:hypothetical protein
MSLSRKIQAEAARGPIAILVNNAGSVESSVGTNVASDALANLSRN